MIGRILCRLARAEETIEAALDCLEENEDRDEVAIAILTEYIERNSEGSET